MQETFKKTILSIIFNLFLFLFLMLGIQNSQEKRKINLLFNETIKLPVAFIVGSSFISGSIIGYILSIDNFSDKK